MGQFYYRILDKSVNSEEFGNFLLELKGYLDTTPSEFPYLVIMDNAPIHKSRYIRDLIASNNLPIEFLPPLSPMLNPIEYSFSAIKSEVKKKLKDLDDDDINEVARKEKKSLVEVRIDFLFKFIHDSFRVITPMKCSNWYNHVWKYIGLAKDKKPIHY